MILCKDCEWMESTWSSDGVAMCTRPLRTRTDLIDGEQVVRADRYCSWERRKGWLLDRCGPDAKFFHPIRS